MSTIKENNPPAWQRITAENPPQFPCWLWIDSPSFKNGFPLRYEHTRPVAVGCSHWHPDQPDAPPSGPVARPIGSLNAEEAEAMVDKFNATPQPGPTPETDACTKKAGSESVMEDAHAYRKLCASLEHERDEARRERDALGQAFDKLREQVVTAEATNATLRNEVKINVKNGLELHTQLTALRQDRDGLAALCEERKAALEATVKFYAEDMPSGPDKADLHCVTKAYRDAYARVLQALALTPAAALARQRERKQEK